MNTRDLARYLVLGGVLSGMTAGTTLLAANAPKTSDNGKSSITRTANSKAAETDKHACKGLNSCKGHGNCKSGDHGCAGKNSCKGKGGCASASVKHDCAGKNACKGQGAGGKNECKGKGGCAVPPKAS
ncbi:MAG TPA: hypothetical protein VJ032_14780 [Thermoanaerobaculia bacterium]|nr:hypothetical protein [Thermoanaerobaculia bacterium]